MANKIITLTIPSDKVAIALQGFLELYPNTEMTDDDIPVAKYTNGQWVNEKLRRLVIRDVRRGLQMIANQAAQIEEDNEMVTV